MGLLVILRRENRLLLILVGLGTFIVGVIGVGVIGVGAIDVDVGVFDVGVFVNEIWVIWSWWSVQSNGALQKPLLLHFSANSLRGWQ